MTDAYTEVAMSTSCLSAFGMLRDYPSGGADLPPFPASVAIRMDEANRGCIIVTARSCQISPHLVNQIDGAQAWATWCSWR